jgi:putative DNA primase/helicase
VRWNSDGLGLPEKVRLAVSNYREDQDTLGDFVSEHLESVLGFSVKKSEVYEAYVRWCGENGLKHPLTSKRLTRALKQREMSDGDSKYWRDTRIVGE